MKKWLKLTQVEPQLYMQKLSKKKIEGIVKEVKTKGYSIIPNLISKKSCKFFCELLENDYKRYSKFYARPGRVKKNSLQAKTYEKSVFNLHNKNLSWFKRILA